MKGKYWQKLLIEWRAKGRDGFSIPYIIGSQQYLPEDHPTQNIEGLIAEIIDTNEDSILLKYCFNIGDLILQISNGPHNKNAYRYPSFRGGSQSVIKVGNFIDDLGDTMEDLISILKERYEGFIAAGEVSINEGERGDYSADEKAFVRDCFGGK